MMLRAMEDGRPARPRVDRCRPPDSRRDGGAL